MNSMVLQILFSLIFPVIIGKRLLLKQIESTAFHWWLGSVCIFIFFMFAHFIRLPLSLAISVYVITALYFVKQLFQNYKNHFTKGINNQSIVTAGFICLCIVVLSESYIEIIAIPISAGDALAYWLFKARAISEWIPLNESPSINYPNLSSFYLLFGLITSAGNEQIARLWIPTALFFWILSLRFLLLNEGRMRFLSSLIMSLALIVFYAFLSKQTFAENYRYFTSGYQDGLLGAVVGQGCFFFILAFDALRTKQYDKGKVYIICGHIFCGAAALIKNEGFILGGIVCASFLLSIIAFYRNYVFENIRSILFAHFIFLLVAFLYTGFIWAVGADITKVQGDGFSISGILHSFENKDRWPLIRKYWFVYLNDYYLQLTLAGVGLAYLTLRSAVTRPIALLLLTSYLFHTLFIFVVFLSTNYQLDWQLNTAFNRLAFQHFFISVIVVTFSLKEFLLQVDSLSDRWKPVRGKIDEYNT